MYAGSPARTAVTTVRAWRVSRPGPVVSEAMTRVFTEVPQPGPGEVLVAVDACGVCRTDLHVVSGDLPVHTPPIVPGHEIVGHVVMAGAGVTARQPGDRVGVAWVRDTRGEGRYCVRGAGDPGPRSRDTRGGGRGGRAGGVS